jgi:flagellar basal-body rod modification protein FlgD
MSTVNPLGSITNTNSTASSTSTNSNTDISETDFLNLLVTQLQNQDPMNPMDSDQFVSQLATFSSLQQLISINQAVTQLAANSGATGTTSGDGSENQSSTVSTI